MTIDRPHYARWHREALFPGIPKKMCKKQIHRGSLSQCGRGQKVMCCSPLAGLEEILSYILLAALQKMLQKYFLGAFL